MNEHNWLLVIAGGQGTRLFPLSHEDRPKQFCMANEEKTFIEETVLRFANFVAIEHVTVLVTSQMQADLAYECLKNHGVLKHNIIIASSNYGYAGCMVYGASLIMKRDRKAIVINTPADQMIRDEKLFDKAMAEAIALAKAEQAVAIGVDVTDTCVAKGLGHMITETIGDVHEIVKFVEKPQTDAEAQKIIEDPQTAGNTGINVWPAALIAGTLVVYENGLATDTLMNALIALKKLKAVFGQFEWHDCGTLTSLWEVSSKSAHGNAYLGGATFYRRWCNNNLFIAPHGFMIYATGLNGLSVVVNKIRDKIVVAVVNNQASQEVRQLAEQISTAQMLKGINIMSKNNFIFPSELATQAVIGFVGINNHGVDVFDNHRGNVIVRIADLTIESRLGSLV